MLSNTWEPTTGAPDADATTDGRAFLARFPTTRRSYVANTFLFAVRHGATTPDQVLARVRQSLHEAKAWSWSDDIERIDLLLTTMDEHPDEAHAYAIWALAWERLTPAQKERHRAGKSETFRRAYMEQQPATARQIAYVRALGYAGEVTSKAHATELIDRLRGERRAA